MCGAIPVLQPQLPWRRWPTPLHRPVLLSCHRKTNTHDQSQRLRSADDPTLQHAVTPSQHLRLHRRQRSSRSSRLRYHLPPGIRASARQPMDYRSQRLVWHRALRSPARHRRVRHRPARRIRLTAQHRKWQNRGSGTVYAPASRSATPTTSRALVLWVFGSFSPLAALSS